MDKKKALLKGPNRRCSPRLRSETPNHGSSSSTKQDQTVTETIPDQPVQNTASKTIEHDDATTDVTDNVQTETPSSPQIITHKDNEPRTPDRRLCDSRQATPQSSSMQRELRKIEDYWTRQDPIKTDSPRLRCQRRREHSNESTPVLPQKVDKDCDTPCNSESIQLTVNEPESLPESPIPVRKQIQQNTPDIKGTDSNTGAIIIHPFTKEIDNNSDKETVETQVVTYTKDHADEDYLPPRKKLRSQVTQDELWEGFPLTVSFKRLTPIAKRTNDPIQNTSPSVFYTEEINDPHEITEININDTNMCSTPIAALQQCPYDININQGTMEIDQRQMTEQPSADKQPSAENESTPNVKRSARLQQKNTKTPNKLVVQSNHKANTQPNSSNEYNEEKLNNSAVHSDTTIVSNGGTTVAEIGSETYKHTKRRLADLSNKTGESDLDDSLRECERHMFKSNDLAHLSISQILTCDSQTSLCDEDVPEVASTIEIDLDNTVLYDKNENPNTDSEAVDSTTEICTEDIVETDCRENSTPDDTPICESGPEYNEPENISVDDQKNSEIPKTAKLSKKSKRRRSTNESQCKDSPVKEGCGNTKQTAGKSENKLGKGSSMFTLIKETKFGKSKAVPPLKIKLKNTNISKRRKCWRVNTANEKESCKETTSAENKTQSVVEDNDKVAPLDESDNQPNKLKGKAGGKKNKLKKKTQVKTPESKTKKTKKRSGSKRDFKKWSPPSNVNLRLNSERRLSMVNGLLSNKVLNNHACVIWSSENRRHMQLSQPNCSASELDEMLREKWCQLVEKEKVRYFQRAWDASKDENKHSTRRQDHYGVEEKQAGDPTIDRFLAMDSKTQHTEIKQWLQFYSEVSHGAYNNVINQFRASLQAEKQEQDQAEKESKSRSKAKKNKLKKQRQKENEAADIDAKHRRLMFDAILKNRQDIMETWAEKKETQAQLLRDNFDSLVRKMVSGDDVDFEPTVKSTRLTDVLHDLRDLEKDKRLVVSGEDTNSASYAALLNEVDVYLKEKKKPSSYLDSLGDECVDHDKVEDYLRVTNKLDEHKMPILNAVAIKHVLDDVRNQSRRHNNLSIYKKHVTLSPPSRLTEWFAEDIIRVNPNIGYRSAVSLLSNKVHPSPAFVTPTLADHVTVTSSAAQRKMQSILSANSNQNCYKTVTYTFARDRNTNPIISKLKRCSHGYNIGRDKTS